PGVLRDLKDPSSVIRTISKADFAPMVADGTISEGMIPKLQNAFDAINDGVAKVVITSPSDLSGGTTILADPETDD
ncbi:MAG: acetylglutamate kinase, partial [Bacteroidales bacterium]|nr:acetylglutamate kinase [Bacteroidales bacterium]